MSAEGTRRPANCYRNYDIRDDATHRNNYIRMLRIKTATLFSVFAYEFFKYVLLMDCIYTLPNTAGDSTWRWKVQNDFELISRDCRQAYPACSARNLLWMVLLWLLRRFARHRSTNKLARVLLKCHNIIESNSSCAVNYNTFVRGPCCSISTTPTILRCAHSAITYRVLTYQWRRQ